MRRYLAYLFAGLGLLLALPPLLEDLGVRGAGRYLALGFVVGGILLVYSLSGLGRRGLERLGLEHLVPGVRVLEALGYVLVLALGLTAAGYRPTALLAGGALAGAVAGLAAQTTLSNILSGLVLMLSGAFRMGEAIRIRSWAYGGVEYRGRVKDITLVHTLLEGPQGEVRIPNARLMDSVIVREERLSLEVTLPSMQAWEELERRLPAQFEPMGLALEGLKGHVYLRAEDLGEALILLRQLASAEPTQG